MSNIAYPNGLGSCLVTATIGQGLLDASDTDRKPDLRALVGEVLVITAQVPRLQYRGDPPILLTMPSVEATISEQGKLIGPDGREGIVLIASDDPELNPTGWVYEARFKSRALKKVPPIAFAAPSGGAVDLATLLPVDDLPGTVYVADVSATVRAEAAAGKAQGGARAAEAERAAAETAAAAAKRDAASTKEQAALATTKAEAADASEKKASAAKKSAEAAVSGFVGRVSEASSRLDGLGREKIQAITQASSSATSSIMSEGEKQVNRVTAEGDKQVQAATAAKAAAEAARDTAQAKAQEATNQATSAKSQADYVRQAITQHGGIQGPRGERGVQGPPGPTGPAPAVSWSGTRVTIGGAQSPDLRGPKGDRGEAGQRGADGTPGRGIINARTGSEMKIWSGARADYDRIPFKDPNTVYLIQQ